MSSDRFIELCNQHIELEQLRKEAIEISRQHKDDYEYLRRLWLGPNGMQNRTAQILETIDLPDAEKYNKDYDACCGELWALLTKD